MKLQFLGTGDGSGAGGLDQKCFLLTTESYSLLIGCGCSALTSLKRAGIDPSQINAIVVSRLHGNHYGGIPFFIREQTIADRNDPLLVIGPPDIEDKIELLSYFLFPDNKPFVPSFEVCFQSFNEESIYIPGHGISISAFRLDISDLNPFAVRITFQDKIICYSGDTYWVDSLVDASANADIFVCEPFSLHSKGKKSLLQYADIIDNTDKLTSKKIFITNRRPAALSPSDYPNLCVARQGMTIEI